MRRAILLFLLLMGCSPLAWSACTVTPTNGVFGTVTSFALNSTEQEISGSLTVQCDAVLLNLLTGNAITMQLSSASAAVSNRAILRRVDNPASTDTIPVRLCGAAGCNNNSETLIGGSYTWSGNALLDLLNTRRIGPARRLRLVADRHRAPRRDGDHQHYQRLHYHHCAKRQLRQRAAGQKLPGGGAGRRGDLHQRQRL